MSDERLINLDYILLVGGFGQCKVLQDVFQKKLGHSVKVLFPMEPQLAVIKGAVLFGHNPLQIQSRIARFTYGRKVLFRYDKNQHDITKKRTYEGKDWCDNCFRPFITKGEEVIAGSVKTFKTVPIKHDQTRMNFLFYRTERTKVEYIDEPEVTKVASATLVSPSGPFSRNIETRVTFGHTEMLIEARDAEKGEAYQMRVTLDFFRN